MEAEIITNSKIEIRKDKLILHRNEYDCSIMTATEQMTTFSTVILCEKFKCYWQSSDQIYFNGYLITLIDIYMS